MGIGMSTLAATGANGNKTDVTGVTGVDTLGVTGTTGGETQATQQQPQQPKEETQGADELPKQEYIPQCGLEDDGENWEKLVPEPRIKESKLSNEEKQKFQGHLDKIFHMDSLTGHRVPFDPDDVMDVLVMVMEYLKSEPMLIEDVPFDITIVGDLHGQLHDLARVFHDDEKDGKPAWENMKYLFLGDYVDRGRQSLEIMMALFCLKMLHPDRIFLLRGNHELISVNSRYGFPVELRDRYIYETAKALYYQFNEVFCYLSAAAIVGGKYFCCHGGVSQTGFTRRHLRAIYKPKIFSNEDVVLHDMLWADPAKGFRGASFNGERNSSQYFGLDVLAHALASVQCVTLFRAHSMLDKGYDIIGNMCISLFTATGMNGGTNDAAVAILDKDGKMKIRIFECDKDRVRWEAIFKKLDARIPVDLDEEVTVDHDEDIGTGKLKEM